MWQKTTLLVTLGGLLAVGGFSAATAGDQSPPTAQRDRSAIERMERHMAHHDERRVLLAVAGDAVPGDDDTFAAPGRRAALQQPPAAPGGAAALESDGHQANHFTLWLDGDAFAALPADFEQTLGSGRLGVTATLALTSSRSADDHVTTDPGDLAVVSRSKPGASRRLSNGERPLGTWVPALIAHPDNPVRNIPSRKLRAILRGTISNWRELRGPDAEIRLILPDDDDSRAMIARSLIPGDQLARGVSARTEEQRVAIAQTDLYALTVVSLAAAEQAAAKPLTVDGITPSASGRRRGTYPFGIDLVVLEGRNPTAAVQRGLELLTGRDAAFLLGSRLSLPGK